MPNPLETIAILKQKVARQTTEIGVLQTILDTVHLKNLYQEPETLILPEGVRQAPENPKVVVSITVNGNGVRCSAEFLKADIEAQGWPAILSQACMEPLGLLASKLG